MRAYLGLLLFPASFLLPGCPAFACGGYEGGGDRMLVRGSESIMVCENGGYAATLEAGIREGKQVDDGGAIRTADGATGAYAFTLTNDGTGLVSSAELGEGWEYVALNEVDLDHAHVQCADLETRTWWASPGVPEPTAFVKPAGPFASIEACEDTQARGEWPESAACKVELLLCPDANVVVARGTLVQYGQYSLAGGTVEATSNGGFAPFSGTYASDGSLSTSDADADGHADAWTRVPASELDPSLRCL